MATLYRPVLIETAEQAEALPVGTVLNRGWPHQPTLVTQYDGRRHYGAPGTLGKAEDAVGWTALVPIEAEEEWIANGKLVIALGGEQTLADVDDYEDRHGIRPSRRFVTPWESV